MANITISPNMNMPVPVVGVDPGPDWANNINASLNVVDSHNHGAGQGVQITPSGLNINSSLTFKGNDATDLNSAIFTAVNSPLSGGAYIGCIYVSGKDLYYNDEDGNQIRITASGNVNAGAGSITGLPSGTASAAFSTNTFTFQSATNTPANMAVGPLIIGANVASSKTVTIAPSNTLAANYELTLPAALPSTPNSIQASDASGNLSFIAPDNSSFGVSGGTFEVLDGGISTAKLADGAVTPAKMGVPTYDTGNSSGSSSTSGTSYVQFTGSTILTLLGGGRPVLISICPFIGTNNTASFSQTVSAVVLLEVRRDGTAISSWEQLPPTSQNSNPFFTVVDPNPTAGSHVYTAHAKQLTGSGTTTFINMALFAVEL